MNKKALLSTVFVFKWMLYALIINAQGLYTIDRTKIDISGFHELNIILLNRLLPELQVEDIHGSKFDLRQYILSHRKHKGKPTLIVTFYDWWDVGIEAIRMVQKVGIPRKYNVVFVLERSANTSTGSAAIKTLLQRGGLLRSYPDISLVTVPTNISGPAFFAHAAPLFLFCDKELVPIDELITLGLSESNLKNRVEAPLRWIDERCMSRKEVWYDRSMSVVKRDNHKAYFKRMLIEQGDTTMVILSFRDTILYRRSFLVKDGILIYHGPHVENHLVKTEKDGDKLTRIYMMNFQQGKPTSDFIVYHENGRISAEIPYNGIMKRYDEEGNLTLTGTMVNGLGEGTFSYFYDNKLSMKVTFVNGKPKGTFERFKNGVLISKEPIKNDDE